MNWRQPHNRRLKELSSSGRGRAAFVLGLFFSGGCTVLSPLDPHGCASRESCIDGGTGIAASSAAPSKQDEGTSQFPRAEAASDGGSDAATRGAAAQGPLSVPA